MEKEKKELKKSIAFMTPFVYLTIIPVTILAFILSLFIIVWEYAKSIAKAWEAWLDVEALDK